MEKNDRARVVIEDIGADGAGIGKTDGYTLFVKDTVPGDEAEVKILKGKKNYGYARVVRILTPSPWRVQPRCPVAAPCGGCQLQAMEYGQQLILKEKKIRENLARIGGISLEEVETEPILGMEEPFGYRNKTQVPVGRDRDGRLVAGFYAGRTHCIIPAVSCAISMPQHEPVLRAVLAWMERCGVEPYDERTGTGLVRHVLIRCGLRTGEILVCLVINGRTIPKEEKLVRSLCRIPGLTSISASVNTERTNVIMGQEILPIYRKPCLEDCIGNVRYRISPLSFFQVNPLQTERLYEKVAAYARLTGEESVWDLYCGIGTISLFLADRAARVYGVEIVADAVQDARENARRNGIENATFFVGKSEEVFPEKCGEEGLAADVVVLDPPRKGCDAVLLAAIARMAVPRVLYVSCDSATLARDLKILCESGYEVVRVGSVDLFPMTVHVETVVLLRFR